MSDLVQPNVSLAIAVTSTSATDFIGKVVTLANCKFPSTTITGRVSAVSFTSTDDGGQRVDSLYIDGTGNHNLQNGETYSPQYYWNLISMLD